MTWSKARATQPPTSTGQVITGTGVMLAWFAAAVVATVYWVSHRSNRAGACGDIFCVSDRIGAFIVAIFIGIPIGAVGVSAGAVLLVLLVRRIRSGWLVGTLAGVGGLIAGVVAVGGGLLVWIRLAPAAGLW